MSILINEKMNILKQKVFMGVLVCAMIFSSLPINASALTYEEIQTGAVLGVNTALYPYPTSSLVNDSGTIYFISGVYKIPFTNWDAFAGLGYSIRNVVNGSLQNYAPYPNYVISTAKATHPWGSWLLNNNVVYYVTQEGLIGVPDGSIFLNNGGEWKFVVYANSYDLAVLKAKPNLPLLTMNDSRILSQSSSVPEAPSPVTTPAPTSVPVPTPTPTPTTSVTPTPAYGETINTLNFFINSSGKALTGSHPLSMTQSGQTIHYVKWANDSYETYTYDNNYIYLKEDHSGSPVPGSYTYSPGKWMKTSMKVGEKIDSSDNQIQNFAVSTDSCTPGTSGAFPYSTTLLQHESSYNLEGDLGVQDVIVLLYDYRTGNYTDYEKSYYARGLGFVKWELYRDGKLIQTSIFNKYSTAAPTTPNLKISCANTSLVPKMPTTISGFTTMLYSCILQNTAPDASGLTYWQQNLQNGSLDARAIYTEFYKIQGTLNPPISNATFTKQLYRCALFRDADEASYNSVLSGLNSNTLSRNSLVQVVLNSNEFSTNVLPKLNAFLPVKPSATPTPTPTPTPATNVATLPTTLNGFVTTMYSCVLNNNAPDTSGFNFWLNNLQTKSLTIPSATSQFFGYQSSLNPKLTNEQFTQKLYGCILYRAVDQTSYNNVITGLSNGTLTQAGLVQSVLSSSEYTTIILPKLQKLIP